MRKVKAQFDPTQMKLMHENDIPKPRWWDGWWSGFFFTAIASCGLWLWQADKRPTHEITGPGGTVRNYQPPVASGPPSAPIESGPGTAPISLDAVKPTRPPAGIAPVPHDEPQIDAARGKLPALPKEWK